MSLRCPPSHRAQGFTLVEVLVALVVVVLGLAALMTAVSGTARTSNFLRDKTVAQWIALNRITEVRLNANINKFGANTDTGELDFANRKWHYDTRYFNTNINSMKRIVVRVYAGEAKAKGNPIAETVGFSSSLLTPGASNNTNWQTNSELAPTNPNGQPATPGTTPNAPGTPLTPTPAPPVVNPPATPPVSNP